MENPTKEQILLALSDRFNSITSNSGPLTDEQLVACFDSMPIVAKTVSPTKGGIKVVFGQG